MSALTVLTIAEGVSNALLSYFFDPKEPVLDLKPLFVSPIDLDLVTQVAKELTDDEYEIHQEPKAVVLVTTKGRRCFLKAGVLPADHPIYNQRREGCLKQGANELHKANMSMLWHETQTYTKCKEYSRRNFIMAAKLVVGLADTNRGRLVHVTINKSNGRLGFSAIFESHDHSLFELILNSDDVHWDLADKHPTQYDAPYMVLSNYDNHGRLVEIIKHRVGNYDDMQGYVGIEYVKHRNEFAPATLTGVKDTVIPTMVINELRLVSVTGLRTAVCGVTGARYYTYDCLTDTSRCMTITIRH